MKLERHEFVIAFDRQNLFKKRYHLADFVDVEEQAALVRCLQVVQVTLAGRAHIWAG